VIDKADALASHEVALTQILELIEQHGATLAAVGHWVVHGGKHDGAVAVTVAVEMQLRQLTASRVTAVADRRHHRVDSSWLLLSHRAEALGMAR
jgi:hypothetical protein